MIEIKDKDNNTVGYANDQGELRQPFVAGRDVRTPPHFRYPATSTELIEFARKFFDKCISVMEAKNARYAGAYDPFRNLRTGGEYGIAIRMGDKTSRLATLTHPTNTVSELDESIEDSCIDNANYSMLLVALRSNERGGK